MQAKSNVRRSHSESGVEVQFVEVLCGYIFSAEHYHQWYLKQERPEDVTPADKDPANCTRVSDDRLRELVRAKKTANSDPNLTARMRHAIDPFTVWIKDDAGKLHRWMFIPAGHFLFQWRHDEFDKKFETFEIQEDADHPTARFVRELLTKDFEVNLEKGEAFWYNERRHIAMKCDTERSSTYSLRKVIGDETPASDPEDRHAPIISHRISPCFPSDHSMPERTDTLMLNAGRDTQLYIDFRPFCAPRHGCEWAFAGRKNYLPDGRRQWTHVIDSRDKGCNRIQHVASMRGLGDGTKREAGKVHGPETGNAEIFREVWKDEEVLVGARVLALKLKARDGAGQSAGDAKMKGIFVRIGHWAQGVVALSAEDSLGARVCARRWEFKEEWREVAAYGPASALMPIPKGKSLDDPAVEIKQECGGVWVTVEDYAWEGIA